MDNNLTASTSLHINATKQQVWDALTKPELIKQYFFGTNTHTDWKAGSPITFDGEWEGKKYQDKGKILDIEEGKMVKYTYWSSMSGKEDKPENYAVVTYTVSGNDGDVMLTITQDNIADEKSRAHSQDNWKMVMNGLKKLVEANG